MLKFIIWLRVLARLVFVVGAVSFGALNAPISNLEKSVLLGCQVFVEP